MGLEVEPVEEKDKRKPVADYIVEQEAEHPCEEPEGDWAEWLQTHRVELNAMTTPQFIAWLDGKMVAYDKLIPPGAVIEAELGKSIEAKVRADITARILRDAGLENQATATIAAIAKPGAAVLAEGIRRLFGRKPDSEWRDHVEAIARELTDGPSSSSYKAALKFIADFKGSPGALFDWWRSKRAEWASLTVEQQTAVSHACNTRFKQLLEQDP